jgi:hypothetical protein
MPSSVGLDIYRLLRRRAVCPRISEIQEMRLKLEHKMSLLFQNGFQASKPSLYPTEINIQNFSKV